MNAWSEWRSRVKEAVDLSLWACGLPGYRKGNPAKALCPFHAEKTPSLAIYKDHAFCYGSCNRSYNLFDLLEKVEGLSKEGALERAAELGKVPRPTPNTPLKRDSGGEKPRPRVAMDLEVLANLARDELQHGQGDLVDKARGYLLERGLAGVAAGLGFGVVSEEVVRKAGLDSYLSHKFVGRLLIPSRHNGRTVTLTARALLGQEPKYDRPGGEIAAPFNADALNIARKSEWVLLCEGELDAASVLVAWGSDAPVLGLPGGKLPQGWAQKLKGLTCYLLMDNDEAGERHGIRLLEELAAQGIKACRVSWMGESENDINALLKKLGPQVLADWLDERLHEAEVPSDRLYVRGAFLGELEARANRPAPAYASGLATLDKLLDGGFTDGLHILGGIAASGKTLLALQLAIHNAEAGRPVIYVSFEQSKFELWARIAARLTSLPIAAFKKGRYVDEGGQTWPMRGLLGQHHKPQMERLEAMARALRLVEGDAGVSSGEGRWTVPVIRAEAERQAEAFGMAPLVVLDYLQRMPAPSGSDRRELRERVAMVASSLQVELARGLGCPVLAISSVNRASYAAGRTRTEGEDLLGVFKESGEVEYSAYTAMLLYRLSDKEAQQQQMLPNMLSPSFDPYILHLVKHREGRPGRVLVKRLGNRGVFEDRGEAKDWQD